jgi:hypothetical protein
MLPDIRMSRQGREFQAAQQADLDYMKFPLRMNLLPQAPLWLEMIVATFPEIRLGLPPALRINNVRA